MRTKTGQVLTDKVTAALAREAKAGHEPTTLRRRRTGQPPLGARLSRRVQVRVDVATYAALQARARAVQRHLSEVVRTALEQYLRRGHGGQ